MEKIYIDMDGVLCKFHPEKSIEEIMVPGYFENLEPMENMVQAVKMLVRAYPEKVFILSSTFDLERAEEKSRWLHKYLPEIKKSHQLFVPYGKSKQDFIKNPSSDDILIDDFTKNLREWQGCSIKAINGINWTKKTWDGYMVNILGEPLMIFSTIIGIGGVSTLIKEVS